MHYYVITWKTSGDLLLKVIRCQQPTFIKVVSMSNFARKYNKNCCLRASRKIKAIKWLANGNASLGYLLTITDNDPFCIVLHFLKNFL